LLLPLVRNPVYVNISITTLRKTEVTTESRGLYNICITEIENNLSRELRSSNVRKLLVEKYSRSDDQVKFLNNKHRDIKLISGRRLLVLSTVLLLMSSALNTNRIIHDEIN